MNVRHILLTGPPGVGKTTAIQKTLDLLKDKSIQFQGFFTEEVKHGRGRIGFDIVSTCGKRGELARISDSATGGLKVGKYTVNVASFEAIALPVFDYNPSSVLILDEIGKMEAFSKPFLERTKTTFSKGDVKILATIPLATAPIPLVRELRTRKDCLVIEPYTLWTGKQIFSLILKPNKEGNLHINMRKGGPTRPTQRKKKCAPTTHMAMNWKLLLSMFLGFLSQTLSTPPHVDTHRYHLENITTGDHNMLKFFNDVSIPKGADEYPQYVQAPQEYLNNYESLLTRGSHPSSTSIHHRNQNFMDLETHQKTLASQNLPDVRIFRLSPPYNNDQMMYHHQQQQHNTEHESDFNYPLKKHDFFRGQQNFDGGWDSFQGGGGFNTNMGNNFGLGQAAGVLKKGKEAKALFVLMAPLILLAVFGPILATQAMIPWVANGGLTSVTTIAGSGKRRRRQANADPRRGSEMEKRLQLFMEVQDFISRTGSQDLVEEMGEAFLRCQKYTERRNKCLERVACAYTDNASVMDPEERRIGKMVLRNVMSNPLVPSSLIGKLNKGFLYGKKRPGQCNNFWCEVVDNPKSKTKF